MKRRGSPFNWCPTLLLLGIYMFRPLTMFPDFPCIPVQILTDQLDRCGQPYTKIPPKGSSLIAPAFRQAEFFDLSYPILNHRLLLMNDWLLILGVITFDLRSFLTEAVSVGEVHILGRPFCCQAILLILGFKTLRNSYERWEFAWLVVASGIRMARTARIWFRVTLRNLLILI